MPVAAKKRDEMIDELIRIAIARREGRRRRPPAETPS
jgi:hypothetical protein